MNYTTQFTKKVAILLPLSGENAAIGNDILNSAMLAAKDYPENIETIVLDSELINKNPSEIIEEIKKHNIDYVIGPVFGKDTQIIAKSLPDVTFFSLSNDRKIARPNIITFGLDQTNEITNLIEHSVKTGKKNILAFIPSSKYGDIISEAINNVDLQGAYVRKIRYNTLSQKDVKDQLSKADFDTLFCVDATKIPDNVHENVTILLPYTKKNIELSEYKNAIICAPNQKEKQDFEMFFRSNFKQTPSDLAIIGYDAANVVYSSIDKRKTVYEILDNEYKGVFGDFKISDDGYVTREMKMYKNIARP